MAESWPSHLQSNAIWSAQAANAVPYLSPEVLEQLRGLIQPYQQSMLNQYNQGFSNQFGSQMSQATNQAGAQAAYRGYNPNSFMQSAQSRVRQDMMPGYFQGLQGLNTDFLGQLLNLGQGAGQWQRQGLMGLSNAYQGVGGMDVNSRMASSMNPNFGDYAMMFGGGLFSGLGGAAGQKLFGG